LSPAFLRIRSTSALPFRKQRGLSSVFEQDTITMDTTDEFLISAPGDHDLITIDSLFTQLDSVDGGDGGDGTMSTPAQPVAEKNLKIFGRARNWLSMVQIEAEKRGLPEFSPPNV
jgi:hypothetical protein